ncbi:DUF1304 domain-containing protein [Levilactobacillus spicheri]|uniref:Membrane protein n=2 Tax=Levilactobacillus spicheri TaxID=216463 RepID=A0ABQ0WN46_9LACO|nr:DUF1304 domain-containing protein [Levilactobacillus spicheri]KRL48314.1 hypothetical protein FD37_GL001442 [Levilactobacillus spicheri DSM 15429]GEO66467.1 membrane protein [Levilactobacillus spicheri]
MQLLFVILTCLVALEHLGIAALEIWGRPAQQANAFGMPLSFIQQAPARAALANQGIYNGMLAVVILGALLLLTGTAQHTTLALLLVFIVVVALFGSLTVKRQIFWLQGCPALLTLLVLLVLGL